MAISPKEADFASSNHDEIKKQTILSENIWFHKNFVVRTLHQIDSLLRECCVQLNISNKLGSYGSEASKTTLQRVQLLQRNGQDILRVNMALLAESVIQTEVIMKYPKMPGGVYRAVAQSDVHWKLQQLQDVGNYCIKCVNIIKQTLSCLENVLSGGSTSDSLNRAADEMLSISSQQISDAIRNARSALCLPRRRTLIELFNVPPNPSFNPPLPSDLVFSYYIGSSRLICAAYVSAYKQNGTQSISVFQAEFQLPYLVDVLLSLNKAFNISQHFRYHLTLLNSS